MQDKHPVIFTKLKEAVIAQSKAKPIISIDEMNESMVSNNRRNSAQPTPEKGKFINIPDFSPRSQSQQRTENEIANLTQHILKLENEIPGIKNMLSMILEKLNSLANPTQTQNQGHSSPKLRRIDTSKTPDFVEDRDEDYSHPIIDQIDPEEKLNFAEKEQILKTLMLNEGSKVPDVEYFAPVNEDPLRTTSKKGMENLLKTKPAKKKNA